ncbi:MAG: fumarylacetoacetate hydrolase family protein [Chloroherpetonaceae bacterium]|nr:fumarylacetoacetate hydrolase family protein [Chthonomonadaceae bacterium]MDW8206740.1 fumarylacetoacetate hydrolase family protein [Chloroherpetonaceae bacterium]
MALCRYMTYLPHAGRQKRWGWVREGQVFPLEDQVVARAFVAPDRDLTAMLEGAIAGEALPYDALDVLPGRYGHPSLVAPIVAGQEVWAAGVTYESSKLARMAESEAGGDFYARVYVADRPELFLKATPHRVVGPNDTIRIRADSRWNVPEPELAVALAANGRILGYTIGNDMSSRDIEGANPLYLPQAKVYRASCALGPVIVPADGLNPHTLTIQMTVLRGQEVVFAGSTSTAQMRRTVAELVGWLFRENDFPQGVFLLTGTGIIPPDDFTLQSGDEIRIEIEGIGTLRNSVA